MMPWERRTLRRLIFGLGRANGVELAGWYHKRYAGPGHREGNLPRSSIESVVAGQVVPNNATTACPVFIFSKG